VRMAKDSVRAEELDDILTREASAIAEAIVSAPTWQPEWPYQAAENFYKVYYNRKSPSQTKFPSFAAQ
jgi:hypothetical protein